MITVSDITQIVLYFAILTVCTPLLGGFMAKVFEGDRTFLTPVVGRIENFCYSVAGVDAAVEMDWKNYTINLLTFNLFGFLFVFLLQLFQASLPLNPRALPNVPWHLAFNTAVSFMTNTNWQSYSGENTLSYLVQMLGLTVQNFLSAATGAAVMIAFVRGIIRRTTDHIGNLWSDIVRSTLYILLPLAVLYTLLLVGQGVVQTFSDYPQVKTVEGSDQIVPRGPAASQIAIKQLGTNGGGFFNANSAHPFENPTPFSNFLEMIAILLLPSALVYTYGRMIGSGRHGWILWGCMMFLMLLFLAISLWSEYHINPVNHVAGGMEGKETRFGISSSVLWSVATTAASNGSVNAMHDSLTPLSGLIAMLNMMLGEIIFGGVGAGMYGMILFVILTVFIAGQMVGRTPEYLGKKIQAFEVKMAAIAVIAPSAAILVFSAMASVMDAGLSGLNNAGPHGFSEILYAFTSAAANNGSAFAGLNTNTPYYNILLALGMLIGRFGVIIPVLAIAGSLARKKFTPPSGGTFPTDTTLFALLLIGVVLIIGALTFFPALSLGPIAEHLLMLKGESF